MENSVQSIYSIQRLFPLLPTSVISMLSTFRPSIFEHFATLSDQPQEIDDLKIHCSFAAEHFHNHFDDLCYLFEFLSITAVVNSNSIKISEFKDDLLFESSIQNFESDFDYDNVELLERLCKRRPDARITSFPQDLPVLIKIYFEKHSETFPARRNFLFLSCKVLNL
jgi:hypothetical protein